MSNDIPKFNKIVRAALTDKLAPEKAIELIRSLNVHQHKIRRAVSKIALHGLNKDGFFVRAQDNRYYCNQPSKELIPTDSFSFGALLNNLFGLNQPEPEFKYLLADVDTKAHLSGIKATIHRFAYYDKEKNILYLDAFNGSVYRLDGTNVELVNNGTDNFLFTHLPDWEPYEYIPNTVSGKNLHGNL